MSLLYSLNTPINPGGLGKIYAISGIYRFNRFFCGILSSIQDRFRFLKQKGQPLHTAGNQRGWVSSQCMYGLADLLVAFFKIGNLSGGS